MHMTSAPTVLSSTLLRGAVGLYGAPRDGGRTHAGIDIVANVNTSDKEKYRVLAVADGTVAYARMNGTQTTGLGYTIVIDHRNGFYTLYAHLATQASSGIVSLGDNVSSGDKIGFLADPANGELSSGNVRAAVVAHFDKIQLHLELFSASSGRTSTSTIGLLKAGGQLVDPTPHVSAFGYQSF